MSDLAVSVKGLTRKFGSFTAVDNISFELKKGEIFALLGHNGAGKSTVIKMLCGILKPTKSIGTVAGYDIMTESEKIKSHIGYMSQKFSLYKELTVEENINFFAGIYGVDLNERKKVKNEILDITGLTDKKNFMASVLTGGWKQRLALACSLLHNPQIIFLDEPTSGVDPVSRRDFWDIIMSLSKQGISVIVTTHYMEEAEYCNHIALMSEGKIILSGTPSQLKKTFNYNIYYLECDDLQKTSELLNKSEKIKDVSLWNQGLRIVIEKSEDIKKSLKMLKEQGIKVVEIRTLRVTLEDVFVYVSST